MAVDKYVRSKDPLGFGFPFTVDPAACGTNGTFPSANRMFAYRCIGGGSISKIALRVGTSSGNISVAVYRNSGTGRASVPGTRLATSGAVACPSSGYAEVSLGATIDVEPGDWFALSCDNNTATFGVNVTAAIDSALAQGRNGYQNTAHPCPSSVTFTANREGFTYCLLGVA